MLHLEDAVDQKAKDRMHLLYVVGLLCRTALGCVFVQAAPTRKQSHELRSKFAMQCRAQQSEDYPAEAACSNSSCMHVQFTFYLFATGPLMPVGKHPSLLVISLLKPEVCRRGPVECLTISPEQTRCCPAILLRDVVILSQATAVGGRHWGRQPLVQEQGGPVQG